MSLTSYQTAPPCNVMEGETLVADHSLSTAIFREPVGLVNEPKSSSGDFLGMAAIRLDRLPRQRSALRIRYSLQIFRRSEADWGVCRSGRSASRRKSAACSAH